LDEKLEWKPQIENVKAKIIPAIATIFKSQGFLSRSLLKQMYFSLVHTHLRYLSGIWRGAAQIYLKELQVLQNRVLKTIFGYPRLFHTKDIYVKNYFLPLHLCVSYNCALFVYRSISLNIHPILFPQTSLKYQLIKNVNLPKPCSYSTKHGLDGFLHRAFTDYNKIKVSVRQLGDSKSFKKSLKKDLLTRYSEETG